MNKKEILEKAQAEKIDEREAFIADKSMRWTYIAMALAVGVFIIVRSIRDLPVSDLCATVCLSVGAGHFYRFLKSKEKGYLIMAVAMLFFGMLSTIEFFLGK